MENVIQRAMILSSSDVITKESLPVSLRSIEEGQVDIDIGEDLSVPLPKRVQAISDQVEKRLIEVALHRCNFKRQEAAKLLGISRKSLHNKMRRYNLFEKER
jgi:DNA-binding NtrC family response regulator